MVKRRHNEPQGKWRKYRRCAETGCRCPHSTQRCNHLTHKCVCVDIGPDYCHSTLHDCACPYDDLGDFNCRAIKHFVRGKRRISEVDMEEDAEEGSIEVDYVPVIAGAYNAAMYSLFGYSLFWAPHKML